MAAPVDNVLKCLKKCKLPANLISIRILLENNYSLEEISKALEILIKKGRVEFTDSPDLNRATMHTDRYYSLVSKEKLRIKKNGDVAKRTLFWTIVAVVIGLIAILISILIAHHVI